MTRFKLILFGTMLAGAACSALAASGRYPISAAQIAASVRQAGVQVTPEQVDLLTDVLATTPAPRLKVRSIEPWGDARMMARLECESSDQCLPFFVGLRVDGDAAQAAADPQASLSASASENSPKNVVLKSGSTATLLWDSERVHIRLSVICLQNGAPGQTVRVTSMDRKLFYRAQVVDGGLLK